MQRIKPHEINNTIVTFVCMLSSHTYIHTLVCTGFGLGTYCYYYTRKAAEKKVLGAEGQNYGIPDQENCREIKEDALRIQTSG